MKKESEFFEEVSRRTLVPVRTVRAVVDALRDEVRNGHVAGETLLHAGDHATRSASAHATHHSDPRAVDELIARARTHRLGVEFLLEGYLDSVAAEFGAHAFTVEAARLRLRNQKRTEDAS